MAGGFSKEMKDVIAEARRIALELGYDYISTVHIMLADCRLGNVYSIHNFAFETPDDFRRFYDALTIGPSYETYEDLPLTVEAELAVKKAFKLWNRSDYFDDYVEPYHLFLAAASDPDSLFAKAFNADSNLLTELEAYYIKIGRTSPSKIHKSWMENFTRKLSYLIRRKRTLK